MNKLNDKCSFRIDMFKYLIMTAVVNTVVCSTIFPTGDSSREEIIQLTCRASPLAFLYSIKAATEEYFRTNYSSEILLLLNSLLFINVFEFVKNKAKGRISKRVFQ